jgi:mono/diheme cytochrome c family protein
MRLVQVGSVVGTVLLCVVPACAQSAAEAGRDVYTEHCAPCHGERLNATGAAPDLKRLGADQRAHFDEIVRNGKGQMPAWDGMITDEEINAIWAYVRSRATK